MVIGTDDNIMRDQVVKSHGVLPTHTVQMSATEAELTKYFSNTYKAMRVTFANGFYNLCQSMGSDYDKVKDAFLFHGVGDGHYLRVNKEFGGFGGTCFPKDINALIHTMEHHGVNPLVLKSVWEQNKNYRKNWDWAENSSAVMSEKIQ